MTGSLRDRRVQAFLGAEAISATGTWATFLAIWGYAAFEFGASPGDVALFGIALTVPGVVLGPVTGTMIDRWGPRATLACAKALGVVASLTLLLADDFRTLAVLSAVHGVVGAVTVPALQALPPRIVGPDELARTNALVALTDEFAIVVGPVIGAVAIGTLGYRGAFVLDAATYLLGLVVLPIVRVRPVADAPEAPPSIRQALDGVRLVARTPALRRIVGISGSVHLLYGAAILAEPLYVRDVLDRSPETFAALQAVFGVTLVGGGVLVARLGDRLVSFGWLAGGAAASGMFSAVYLGTSSVVVAFVGVASWGLVTAVLSGPSRTLLQRQARESLHGRVLATDWFASATGELSGVALAAVLIAAVGVSPTMVLLGLAVAAFAAILGGHDRRSAGVDRTGAPADEPAAESVR